MQQPVDIKGLIEAALPDSQVFVKGDGCNASVVVVSEAFEGQSLLACQRMVYAAVNEYIACGAIHALSIKSYTPAQWESLPDKEALVS